ncbi:hypothetical protein BRADI_3g53884v3 [Brachypodium distachyon]|uniref:Uncharacterized protein n=1 Tax=Brachypodium distachyon TaxID=15368 RepID=A0A0Q3I5H1_BRADI|nr:hypothetical protein BRADI_3g53884v3 [Brachypodium distachyon]
MEIVGAARPSVGAAASRVLHCCYKTEAVGAASRRCYDGRPALLRRATGGAVTRGQGCCAERPVVQRHAVPRGGRRSCDPAADAAARGGRRSSDPATGTAARGDRGCCDPPVSLLLGATRAALTLRRRCCDLTVTGALAAGSVDCHRGKPPWPVRWVLPISFEVYR